MLTQVSKNYRRQRIHRRIRHRLQGVTSAPRLNVFRSLKHIHAQIVDDARGATLVSASSCDAEIRKTLKSGGNIAAAKVVGKALAERAKNAGISRVVFDRGGYTYHGRVKALADEARQNGLTF
ncbi:MAG TPA: 50S ribosomal protein L18 [Terriglobia bacterium]|nr:50S ribosomal protein L18 [Terriglobia bacterium]